MSTVFTKPVVINAPEKDVVFNGVDFTKDALIKITAAKSVTIKNCRFYGLTPTKKAMGITLGSDNVKLVVEGCFFGVNNDKLYNFFELYGKLADGSSISRNYFVAKCCTHNQVNIYNVMDDATINVNSNYMASIRIGPKGAPQNIKINVKSNEYNVIDTSDPDWINMVIIQPYSDQTKSFNGVTINVDGTKTSVPDNKLVYIYAGGKDTKFNWQTNYPVLYLNGKLVEEITNMGDPVEGTKPGEEEEQPVDPTPDTNGENTEETKTEETTATVTE